MLSGQRANEMHTALWIFHEMGDPVGVLPARV